jgi:hypothetical protein
MAVQFLNNIDLNNNQILNVRLQNLGTAPTGAGAVSGSIYFNSAAGVNRPAWHDGTNWYQIYPASATTVNNTVVLRDGSGNATANTFIGALQGNADTATKLLNARNIGISGSKVTATAASFDGSASVNIDVTALSVVPGDIALASGSFIVGNGSNVGAATAKSSIPLSGFGVPAANVDMGANFRIINLQDPTNAQDAATKNYVDSVAQGLDVKQSVRIYTASIGSGTYSATSGTGSKGQLTGMSNVVDGVTLANNDRVLVNTNSPTGAALNGIWVVATVGTGANGIWNRASDFINDSNATGVPPNSIVTSASFTFVEAGTSADSGWVLTTDANPIVVGGSSGTALAFTQFSGAGQIDAGAGLTKSGNTINAVGTAGRITVNPDSIDISSIYAGQTSITTLGTITQGTWQGATIAVNQGGTGLTTYNTGSLLYAGGATVISQLAPVAVGSVLISGGVSPNLPSWGKVGLATHVSGILPVANGGTGVDALATGGVLIGNGASPVSASTASTAGQFLVSADTTLTPTWRSMSGDASLNGNGQLTIVANAITFAKFQQVSALSVVGNPTNTQATASAITASNDHQVLRRSGTSVGFGSINLASANAVTGTLPSGNGGTGSAYFQVSGPSSLRTYTFNNFNSQVPAFYAATISGNGSATQFTVTHSFGSKDVAVYVYQSASPYAQVFVDVTANTNNAVELSFASAVANGTSYRVVVMGFGPDPGGV